MNVHILSRRHRKADAPTPDNETIGNPLRRPGLRLPQHRSTTRHLASLYPCQIDPGLGSTGILMGTDLQAGSTFHYDAFDLYNRGIITSPNMVILGLVGRGKSTVVKTLLYRSLGLLASPSGQPRFAVIADPKGEYAPLANALGMTRLKLFPGGPTRLNPLDPGPHHGTVADLIARRSTMTTALTAGILGRPLHQIEDAAIGWAIDELTPNCNTQPTLGDLARLLTTPTQRMIDRSGVRENLFLRDCQDARLALEKLLDRSFAGMFDGPSTYQIDWHGRGIIIDLSGVTNTDAQPLVMIAATGWLQQLLATPESATVPRRYQIMEEIWALLANPHIARYYQACQKLSRTYGIANIAVSHRLEDFTAQTNDGTSTTKIGAGLIADTQTAVLFNLPPSQATQAAETFGLPTGAAQQLTQLTKGQALWKIGDHLTIVQHHITPTEQHLTDTDQSMR